MSDIKDTIHSYYGNRIRVRACGIALKNTELLLVKHAFLNDSGVFWNPPGGGVEENETVTDALKREFREECGLAVEVGKLLFINEFVQLPLHGIELFFEVKVLGDTLMMGSDPEMAANEQLIKEVAWLSWSFIEQLSSTDKPSYLQTKKIFKNKCKMFN